MALLNDSLATHGFAAMGLGRLTEFLPQMPQFDSNPNPDVIIGTGDPNRPDATPYAPLGRKAVFFDYGGTLSTERFHGLPSETAATAVAMVNTRGLLAVVVSNQKGVAQGRLTWPELVARRDACAEFLQKRGALVDAWYFCTHDEPDDCLCRKPKAGMLLAAAHDLGVDLAWVGGHRRPRRPRCGSRACGGRIDRARTPR